MPAMALAHPTSLSTEPALSRASPLPQGVVSISGFVHATKPVGAGLPAMALAHPTSLSTEPAPSRASPLPQWIVSISGLVHAAKPVGAGLPAKAVYQSINKVAEQALSLASQLPQGSVDEYRFFSSPQESTPPAPRWWYHQTPGVSAPDRERFSRPDRAVADA